MRNSTIWISVEREYETFEDIRGILDEEQTKTVNIINLILNVNNENINEVYEAIKKSDKKIIRKCIIYFMIIRPLKEDLLRALFFEDNDAESFIECQDSWDFDIYNIGNDPIEQAIKDDNDYLFIELSSKYGFDSTKGVVTDEMTILYYIDHTINISYLQLMAFFGAAKCFKRAYNSGIFPTGNLNKFAIAGGNYEIIQILRQKSKNYFDYCFEVSVIFHHYEISDWLLSNYKCEKISQAFSAYNLNYLALYFLKANKIDCKQPNLEHDIFRAAFLGKNKTVKYLIKECGYNPNRMDNNRGTIMHFLSQLDNNNLVEHIIKKYGGRPNILDKEENTILHLASRRATLEYTKFLIEKFGCNPNQTNKNGDTALHCCRNFDNIQKIRYLIEECGCNPNQTNNEGNTALHVAAKSARKIEIINYLVEKCGCDPNQKNKKGKSLIHFTAKMFPLQDIEYIIEKYGCNPKEENNNGTTPVHYAAKNELPVLKLFVEKYGCNPNKTNKKGNTALHYACRLFRKLDNIKYLIEECKCNPNQKNKYYENALDKTSFFHDKNMIEYLKKIRKSFPEDKKLYISDNMAYIMILGIIILIISFFFE